MQQNELEQLVQREKELIDEINSGNASIEIAEELMSIAVEFFQHYKGR